MTRVSLISRTTTATLAVAALFATFDSARAQQAPPPPLVGRWDLVVADPTGPYPSWLEVTPSGFKALVGRFVGRFGSARPIGSVTYNNGAFSFAIPPQWEQGTGELRLEGKMEGERLSGTIVNPAGDRHAFTGSRAPALKRATAPTWGAPVMLFNGKDLTGWTIQPGPNKSQWKVVNGVLTNPANGANLVSTADVRRLQAAPRVPLSEGWQQRRVSPRAARGADRGQPAARDPVVGATSVASTASCWPNENASTGPGQWQTYDITLVGRRVTIVLNGKTVIGDQIIPGITGGALDSDEGSPGPILLQGDHTAVEYRNMRLTPAK